MEIAEAKDSGVLAVMLKGRLDAASAKTVEDQLLARIGAGETRLALDLAQLDYISSVGLRVLMVVAKRVKPAGGKVVVCALQPTVKQVFDIAGFGNIFRILPTRQEAVAALK